jgi:adenosine deaminase/aminodeoxyfutalosine deaminase
MGTFHRQLRKADLHLHLEGSIEPETLHELAPRISIDEIRTRYHYRDFQGFLQSFKWVTEQLKTPEDYAFVTRRLLERLESENIQYAEITLSAGVVLRRGQQLERVYEAVRCETQLSRIQVWWLFDAVRQFGTEAAMRVAEIAAGLVRDGVVGFGVGGDEARAPAALFVDVYRFAHSKGLRLTAHAGETAGPESIWDALRVGAERIGHGIRAIEDRALVRYLRDHAIPLEVCVSSNLATGVVNAIEAHPLRCLFDAGVPIVLGTDDPGMFGTSLTREYELASEAFGFSEAELHQLSENSFRYAFRPVAEPPLAQAI